MVQALRRIKPAPLKMGDTIAIAAPASHFDLDEFLKGVDVLRSLGFSVKWRDDIFEKDRYLAGSDIRRLSELVEHLRDPSVKALLFARGGYGCLRLLDQIPKMNFPPKIILGYSDLTSLLVYSLDVLNWTCLHGPVVAKGLQAEAPAAVRDSFIRALTQAQPLGDFQSESLAFIRGKRTQGVLVGGCLSILNAHLGTPYRLETEQKILFLEDTGEKAYRVDRLLTQLRLAGVFEKIKGLIFGPFAGIGLSFEEWKNFIDDFFTDFDFPIVLGFPSGHLDYGWTIPFGVQVEISPFEKKVVFLESHLGL